MLHQRHHKYLGDARDPDDYKNYVRNPSVVWLLHFVRIVAGSPLYLVLIPLFALKYGSREERRAIGVEYAFLFATYAVLLRVVPLPALVFTWFVPLLVVGAMTSIRGFTQHEIADRSDPYLASRTMLPNPLVAFFLLHENFHLEHHLFPEVPSYYLPRLHRLIWPRLPHVVTGRSYLAFLLRFLRATPRLDETPIGLTIAPAPPLPAASRGAASRVGRSTDTA